MNEELENLDIDALRELLKKEENEKKELVVRLTNIEGEVQKTTLEKEKQEERLMNHTNKKIKQLKSENFAVAQKIQQEEKYIKSTLSEKYKSVIRDKEMLEETLNYQEQQVVDRLQMEIDRVTQESADLEAQLRSHEIDDIPFETDKIDVSLSRVAKETEKAKNDYERELANLKKEIERTITANSILFKRVSVLQLQLISKQQRITDADSDEMVYIPEIPDEKNRRFSDIPKNTMKRSQND